MFWGLKLENNKVYCKTAQLPFRLTSAVLDVSTSEDKFIQVGLKYDNVNYVLCNLNKEKGICQAVLDLQFDQGSEVAFFKTGGEGSVHLIGYEIDEEDDVLSLGEEVEEGNEEQMLDVEVPTLAPIKRKKDNEVTLPSKKARIGSNSSTETKSEENSTKKKSLSKPVSTPEISKKNNKPIETPKQINDSGSSSKSKKGPSNKKDISLSDLNGDDLDEDLSDEEYSAEEEEEEDEEDDDDFEEEDEDSDLSEEEGTISESDSIQEEEPKKSNEKPSKKKSEQIKKSPVSPTLLNGKTNKGRSKSQDNKKTPDKNLQNNNVDVQGKKFSKKGITVQDMVVGTGTEAKNGHMAHVYYEGRFRHNSKLFDKKLNGKPFNFRVGQGEVIKGWDVGVEGMKVGGKRRLMVPPNMAYGPKGSPPDIPPNSYLVFEVELKQVKKS